ncbi:alpha/beta hydrolase [Amnibacterium flavum]|uniref:Alpha/beta hydrolase n=2 Tax=Amnibacterium flavum TaxID=2173173 RepID=A0A2V1HV10_9MICO|nr:alpha/beta hydrolase [Amnibacterium flavum]
MPQRISIPRGSISLAADLYLPDGFDDSLAHPAIVVATPGSSVKEQIGANYAARLAARGFVALTFDPAHQGESGGEPRDLEDPYRRGEDISYAVDALGVLPGVDPLRIGALGICAGGGYAVHTARTDHRIKALGTVVASNIGGAFRSFLTDGAAVALDALAAARTEESARGESDVVNWLPDARGEAVAAGITDIDLAQAIDYYRTPRGGHGNSTNRRLSRSDSLILGYDAFHLVDQLLTQPLQVIIAEHRGSTLQYEDGMTLWNLAPNPVDLLVIEGARHVDLYDRPEYVGQAVERLTAFYRDHL